jgi:hypothetical protein
MRSVRRALAAGSLLVLVGPAGFVLADAGSGTATVKPSAEAWYRTTPACALPTGCVDLSALPSPFPADTLHVAVALGQELARTYVALDLTGLPSGTKPEGGTLRLPLGPETDGTLLADMATVQACAVSGSVTDVDGAFTPPPTADCTKASTPAKYAAAAGTTPAMLTVDLGALASAWSNGAAPGAIALVPSADTAPPATWAVAFSDRKRTGDGVVPISASVSYVTATLDDEFGTDFPEAEQTPPAEALPPVAGLGGSVVPPVSGLPQAEPAPVTAPQQPATTPVASVSRGFQYPAVFLFPIALAIAAGYLGRALTRDLSAE